MKQINAKKLQLTSERLRTLTTVQLDKIAGGIKTDTSLQGCTSIMTPCPSVFC